MKEGVPVTISKKINEMDSVAVGVTCGYYSWIYDFVSDFNDS